MALSLSASSCWDSSICRCNCSFCSCSCSFCWRSRSLSRSALRSRCRSCPRPEPCPGGSESFARFVSLTGSAKDQLAMVCSFCPAENKGLNSCVDNLRAAQSTLSRLLTEYKTDAGKLIGLRDDRLVTRKTAFEAKIRRAVEGNAKIGAEAGKGWEEITAAYRKWKTLDKPYEILEGDPAPGSRLFRMAESSANLKRVHGIGCRWKGRHLVAFGGKEILK